MIAPGDRVFRTFYMPLSAANHGQLLSCRKTLVFRILDLYQKIDIGRLVTVMLLLGHSGKQHPPARDHDGAGVELTEFSGIPAYNPVLSSMMMFM